MTSLTTLVALAALASTGDAVLVQFASENCQPCRAMQPAVSRLISDGYPVQRIDVDQHAETARQFQVRAVPTFVLLVGGREVGRVEGATSYDRLAGMFQALPPSDRATPAATQTALQPTEFRSSASPDQAALAASVRLKVEDAAGFGFGTGTIIDTHEDEALVVTCGHLFRESQGKGRILVDLFAPGATQPVEGHVIAYDLNRDIAVVSIRPGIAVTPATVAPAGHVVRPRDRVFTVGCDKGADATVRQSEITAVDKYQGKPNFTAAGAPIDGRSGGGLFTAEGLLIGICNAADPQDDEGLYAGLASIHWQLDQIGASAVYQRAAPGGQLAGTAPPATVAPASFSQFNQPAEPPAFASSAASDVPRSDLASLPQLPAQMPGQAAPQTTAAGLEATLARGLDEDTELVVIIRSKRNPQTRSEIYVVDQASPELLTNIVHAARRGAGPAPAAIAATPSPVAQPQPLAQQRYPSQPVVRGQSAD